MRVAALAVLLLTVATLSGCLTDDRNNDENGPGDANGIPQWPALADATVRPGVGVVSSSGSCTSNFVFQSPDNRTLYLGLAAHCLPGESENEQVEIAGGEVTATVAYNSWYTMDNLDGDPGIDRSTNDFALIEIPDDARDKVHPAIRHYGGPVDLALQAEAGDRILTYGNTPLRQGIEPSNTREGYVVESSTWYTSMYIVTPGLPGDSGSAVLDGQGRALGVLIHLGIAPLAASNGAVNLAPALDWAHEHAGIEAQLATWEILDPGVFPDAPGPGV